MLRATVSGSFHRHMPAVYTAVGELRAAGVEVLSPSDPRVVDHLGEFLFVASDRLRSIKLVQDRHFEAIRNSDFLWIVCPDGYTGTSTSAEIGAAHVSRIPVYSDHLPLDTTLQHYVSKVTSIRELIKSMPARSTISADPATHFLLEPEFAIGNSIQTLEMLQPLMLGTASASQGDVDRAVRKTRKVLQQTFS